MKRKSPALKKPIRSSQVPATSAMLYEMEERLVHRMDQGFNEMKSEISGMKSEINGVKTEISGMKSQINGVKTEISGMKSQINGVKTEISGMRSQISGVKSELHRVALLVEEQNSRNKYVMDGYAQIYELLVQNLSGPR